MSRTPIRTLLVDDEQPARERLRRLLEQHPEVAVVGEADDGELAMERIVELAPGLVFLDIQMPGADGLEVAASLPAPRPQIVFCTAYDEYAVDAFELHAVDYLLKPVTRARLAKAIERVLERPAADAPDAAIERAAREAGAPHPSRFLAKRGARFFVVPRQDVLCFLSEEGLTVLRTANHRYWMQPSLSELETRLDDEFFRVSRGAIVRLDAVREVVPLGGGQGELRLADGQALEVSRRRFKELLARLGEPG